MGCNSAKAFVFVVIAISACVAESGVSNGTEDAPAEDATGGSDVLDPAIRLRAQCTVVPNPALLDTSFSINIVRLAPGASITGEITDGQGLRTFSATADSQGDASASARARVAGNGRVDILGRRNRRTITLTSCTFAVTGTPAPVCGNAIVESGEICDGNCPLTCDDGVSCTADTMSGSAAACNAICSHSAITACTSGDGCCPSGCSSANDSDCAPAAPVCGNGIVESGEICDGNCPLTCDDGVSCTADTVSGSAAACNAVCSHSAITACTSGDGCCPSGCSSANDSDCAPAASCEPSTFPILETVDPDPDVRLVDLDFGEDADGTLHVAYSDNLTRTLRYGSKPAAGAWTFETVEAFGGGGFCPAGHSLALDSAGGVHLSYYVAGGEVHYARRNASGGFAISTAASAGATTGCRDAGLAVGADGGVLISFYDATAQDLRLATRAPGAPTFAVSTVDANGDSGRASAIGVDSTGTTHIVYKDGTNGVLRHAERAPGGAWQFSVVASGVAVGGRTSVSLALGAAASVHVAYASFGLHYAVREPGASTFAVETVDSRSVSMASLALDASDSVHISYNDVPERDLWYAHRATDRSWEKRIIDGDGETGFVNAIALSPDGTVDFAYSRRADFYSVLWHASLCPGVINECSSDTFEILDPPSSTYDVDLKKDAAGTAHLVFADITTRTLRYGWKPAAGAWTFETVEAFGGGGFCGAGLALDSAGGVHLSYYVAGGAVHYARRNASGGFAISTAASAGATTGCRYMGLAVGADGGVLISFYDATAQDLRLATRAPGAPTFTVSTVDANGDSGRTSAIGVDSAGTTHIVYHDRTNGVLRHAERAPGGAWQFSVVASGLAVGGVIPVSLALGAAASVHVAYASYGLRYAIREPGASTFAVETVDLHADAAGRAALALDADLGVHISVNSARDYDLYYVRRIVGGSWQTRIVDSEGEVGGNSALVSNPDGGVDIVYTSRDYVTVIIKSVHLCE